MTVDRDDLIALVERQKHVLTSVATGGPRIDAVNSDYARDYRAVAEQLEALGLEYPNPFSDLWIWHGAWKEYATYAERRAYVAELFAPLLRELSRQTVSSRLGLEPEATGWERVDDCLTDIRSALDTASSVEDFQAIGLRCREVLITLGQTVYDPNVHGNAPDGVTPSRTDASRMLAAFTARELPGPGNENLRRHIKTAAQLANDLQHRRSANLTVTALTVEATRTTVKLVAIVSGALPGLTEDNP